MTRSDRPSGCRWLATRRVALHRHWWDQVREISRDHDRGPRV